MIYSNRVFLDIRINGKDVGRLEFSLFEDTPLTSENFRALCIKIYLIYFILILFFTKLKSSYIKAQVKKEIANQIIKNFFIIRTLYFIELFLVLWLKVEILPKAMEPEENQFMAQNLMMKILNINI